MRYRALPASSGLAALGRCHVSLLRCGPRHIEWSYRMGIVPLADSSRVLARGRQWLTMIPNEHDTEVSERQAHAEATYERLFGPRDNSAPDNDPELMEILRRFIFGDVFDTGVLDDQTRELITVTVLACLQTLPQPKSHTAAAQCRRPTDRDS
jgi:hypothetical protein